jgi:Family of unknown function (DUF6882)
LNELLDGSFEELKVLTEGHTAWGLGTFKRWDLDQERGLLVFTDPERGRAEAPAQIAGTYNAEDGTWLWAWANPSISGSLARDSHVVREYGDTHGFAMLTQSEVSCTEEMAWKLAALTMKMNKRQGVYRGPASDTLHIFLVFDKVTLSQPGTPAR